MQSYIEQFDYKVAIIVFIGYIIIDFLYADYIVSVSRRQPLRAALVSSIIYSLLAMGVITYSKNPLYVIPLSMGAFIGTYALVRYRNDSK